MIRYYAVAFLMGVSPTLAASHVCGNVGNSQERIRNEGGHWAELTPKQYEFMKGIYAMVPSTPPGLPLGDKAVMTSHKNGESIIIWFLDGDRVCDPMPVPQDILQMLSDVEAGVVSHEITESH